MPLNNDVQADTQTRNLLLQFNSLIHVEGQVLTNTFSHFITQDSSGNTICHNFAIKDVNEALFEMLRDMTADECLFILRQTNARGETFLQAAGNISSKRRGKFGYLFLKNTNLSVQQLQVLEGEKANIQQCLLKLNQEERNAALLDVRTSLGRYIKAYCDPLLGYHLTRDFVRFFETEHKKLLEVLNAVKLSRVQADFLARFKFEHGMTGLDIIIDKFRDVYSMKLLGSASPEILIEFLSRKCGQNYREAHGADRVFDALCFKLGGTEMLQLDNILHTVKASLTAEQWSSILLLPDDKQLTFFPRLYAHIKSLPVVNGIRKAGVNEVFKIIVGVLGALPVLDDKVIKSLEGDSSLEFVPKTLILNLLKSVDDPKVKEHLLWLCLQQRTTSLGKLFTVKSLVVFAPSIYRAELSIIFTEFKKLNAPLAELYACVWDALHMPDKSSNEKVLRGQKLLEALDKVNLSTFSPAIKEQLKSLTSESDQCLFSVEAARTVPAAATTVSSVAVLSPTFSSIATAPPAPSAPPYVPLAITPSQGSFGYLTSMLSAAPPPPSYSAVQSTRMSQSAASVPAAASVIPPSAPPLSSLSMTALPDFMFFADTHDFAGDQTRERASTVSYPPVSLI